MGQNAILEDDQVFLHLQERYLVKKGGGDQFSKAFYLPTKADLYVFEFRQWISQYKADPFPGQALPARQTREQLLDRHSSHTENCSSCRTALKRIRQIRLGIVGAIVLVLAAAQIVVSPGITLGIAIALSGLWLGLGKWEHKLLMGDPIPARNR
jgi:phenylpropionate dioxygenase-like ring-hydroxylating dioxygenase large terminal subunit